MTVSMTIRIDRVQKINVDLKPKDYISEREIHLRPAAEEI